MIEITGVSSSAPSSSVQGDADRYRDVVAKFQVAKTEGNDNQQLVLLSFLQSVTKYTNAQLNQLIGLCITDEDIVLSEFMAQVDDNPKYNETHTTILTEDMDLVQILTMPQHFQLFAYGVRHYMLSDGRMKTVNSCTRKIPGIELFDAFERQCLATGRRVPTREQFRIALEATSGSNKNKLLTALDSVLIKDGIDNFKTMRLFVRDFAWTTSMLESLINLVDEVETVLRTEFPQHIAEDSSTAMHSFWFAFNCAPVGQSSQTNGPPQTVMNATRYVCQ